MKKALLGASLLAMLSPWTSAAAGETVTYSYDALGRLIAVQSSGTVNNGQSVTPTFDAAGNRTNYTVTGAVTPSQALSIGNASVTEGGDLVFTVTLSPTAAGTVTVGYATASGTATSGSDFAAASGTLTFAPGESSKTITVATIDDTTAEPDETMTVTLSGATGGAAIGTATGTGTIIDNDAASPANLTISNASVTEGGTLVFTVTRSGNTSIAASASYATASGTATSGSDFTSASGTVSFAPGETTKTISVATIDDSEVESTETMAVALSSPSVNTTITTATGTGTINDNDVAPASLSIANATAEEGSPLGFVVTRSGNITGAVTVNYATSDGTATTSGSDYTATSGTLSFAANQTTATINVPTTWQDGPEWPETMTVTLFSPSSGATIATGTATGTIRDYGALYANETKTSSDGRFTLKMQTDGNLVLYWGATALWATGTNSGSGYMAAMQKDGNLVVYRPATGGWGGTSPVALWSSNTYYYPYARLDVQNDGNLVIYNTSNISVWSSNTCCH